jgi:serine/threonine-protein kinase
VRGLAAAHDEGVLHRDLKPANVMIDGRGRAKITDFGLAGATGGISGLEAQVGTPQYMAPEQLAGRELSERTDIYSLGLVLYELFTGKRAFEAKNLNELARLQSSTPTSPSVHVTGLNPAIERAILRCVDPDPAKRPSSAASLAARCQAAIRSRWRWPRVKRRHRKWWRAPAVRARCVPASPSAVWCSSWPGWVASGWRSTATIWRIASRCPSRRRVGDRRTRGARRAGYTHPPADSAFGFDATRVTSQGDRGRPFAAALGQAAVCRAVPRLVLVSRESCAAGARGTARRGHRLEPAPHTAGHDVHPPRSARPIDASSRRSTGSVRGAGPWAEPAWNHLLAAAGFDETTLAPSDPLWSPLEPSDVRRAWTTKDRRRIEAGAFAAGPSGSP